MHQTKKLKTIHAEAMEAFDAVQELYHDVRKECLSDRRFYSITGAQWEGALGEQFENKPKFELNKVHLAVIRIINEYRNNPVTVDFIAKDGAQNKELADTCDSLYRADEQDSNAQEAYDNAFEEGVGGGFGAFRLCGKYEDESDEENENQRIKIEPIVDADSSVYFDVDSKRYDKSDASKCWVITGISHGAYMERYGKEATSIDKSVNSDCFDWITSSEVYIAEYYATEDQGRTLNTYERLDEQQILDADEMEEGEADELEATGWIMVKSRKIKRQRVHKYIIDGAGVLEDCGLIAGEHIPIIPYYGKRWFVDGVERCMGHVRLAKDAQRLKNMQTSKLAEISALSPMEKPIFTPEQMAGHNHLWETDNINNYPYMLVNAMEDAAGNKVPAGAIGYTKPPTLAPAMAALLQLTDADMSEILGNQQQGEELLPNQSGVAVEMVQNRLDMQSFIYTSNWAKSIKRAGEVWLSMARELYADKGRKIRGLTKEGEPQSIEIARDVLKEGKLTVENDMSQAKFNVATDVGPSSSSRRSAVVRSLTNVAMLMDDPQDKKVIVGTALMNLEGEGLADVREYFRKAMVSIGAAKPTDEEQKEMDAAKQNAKPDPQAAYLEALAGTEIAKARKAASDTMLNVERSAQVRVETMKTAQEIDNIDASFDVMEQVAPQQPAQPQEVNAVVVSPDQIGQ
jgi:hypothetical protein